ncbi:hypothetical protein [Nocardioides sp.]|uniref:hypothetical protein n=1 Tax=Nocardioides sp. TaxID=35761 RepID=UPI00352711CC
MLLYLRWSVPWVRVAVAALLVATLIELVHRDAWLLWPLEGTAVALLAGAAAWCLDEQAGAVVDVTPRGLAWRTAARAPAPALLAGVWLVTVWHARDSLFGHAGAVLVQGLAALAAGTAWATSRRAAGNPMPGLALAATVIPAGAGWALVRPLPDQLPVFPYGTATPGQWATSLVAWSAVAAASLVVLALELAEARWWLRRRRPVTAGGPGRPDGGTTGVGHAGRSTWAASRSGATRQ